LLLVARLIILAVIAMVLAITVPRASMASANAQTLLSLATSLAP
jgi:hypothetical protein